MIAHVGMLLIVALVAILIVAIIGNAALAVAAQMQEVLP